MNQLFTFRISVPNHERSEINLGNFKEYQKLTGEDQPKKPEEKERKFSYMATNIPQSRLKNFDWFEERRIFKKLCRGDPMPRVSEKSVPATFQIENSVRHFK